MDAYQAKMEQEFLQIDYDADNKIWTSSHYPYKDQVYGSLGERFLKTMRNTDPNKIIDHFYDTNRQKTVNEIYQQSITVAINLKRLGIRKNDVVVFYCMNNENISVLSIGCILIGALVNYCEVHMVGVKTKPTHVFGAPTLMRNILVELNKNDKDSLKFIKTMLLGGEPTSEETMNLSKRHMVNARIFQCYGMTEMSSCITNDEDINGGKLLPGYQMQILDDHCKPLGPKQNGQITIKPPYPLMGYRCIDNTKYYNEKGFFINGDYGHIDKEGNLHILARYKDLIYSNNITLIPNSLEQIVINLPEITVARLAGYRKTPDDLNECGAFFVVLNPELKFAHNDITKKIFNTLKAHMTPEEMAVIENVYYVNSVPLTTCGKVDRVALKQWALTRLHSK